MTHMRLLALCFAIVVHSLAVDARAEQAGFNRVMSGTVAAWADSDLEIGVISFHGIAGVRQICGYLPEDAVCGDDNVAWLFGSDGVALKDQNSLRSDDMDDSYSPAAAYFGENEVRISFSGKAAATVRSGLGEGGDDRGEDPVLGSSVQCTSRFGFDHCVLRVVRERSVGRVENPVLKSAARLVSSAAWNGYWEGRGYASDGEEFAPSTQYLHVHPSGIEFFYSLFGPDRKLWGDFTLERQGDTLLLYGMEVGRIYRRQIEFAYRELGKPECVMQGRLALRDAGMMEFDLAVIGKNCDRSGTSLHLSLYR